MTVRELKEKLNKYDEDYKVCLGFLIEKDIECNVISKEKELNCQGIATQEPIISLWYDLEENV